MGGMLCFFIFLNPFPLCSFKADKSYKDPWESLRGVVWQLQGFSASKVVISASVPSGPGLHRSGQNLREIPVISHTYLLCIFYPLRLHARFLSGVIQCC